MIVCLDFDGVLHDAAHPVPGRKMGPPCDGALEGCQRLAQMGHTLVVHSARCQDIERVRHVADWLTYYSFPAMIVLVHKPMADVYVDDKALRHESWATTLAFFVSHPR